MSTSAPPSDHASPLLSARSSVAASARKKKSLHSRSSSLSASPLTAASSAVPSASPPLTLSYVVGHTATSPFAHSTSPSDPPLLAYTAGSILALYNPRTHSHSYIRPPASASLACCAFAPTGQLIAVGEAGKGGGIHVYDTGTLERVGGIDGLHEHGVRCIRWNKAVEGMLLSVGEPTAADEVGTGSVTAVCLSDWRTGDGSSAAVHVLYESISAADCSEDGSHVVLCGDKGLTVLDLTLSSEDSRALGAFDGRRLAVERQEVKLGPVHRAATFTSVVCGLAHTADYMFALTSKGVLCAFTQKDRKKAQAAASSSSSVPTSPIAQRWAWEIEKWVDLRLETGYCLSIAASSTAEHKALLAIGGAEGKVRLFEPEKLAHVATLPRPPPFLHAASSLSAHSSQPAPAGSYPPVLAVSLYSDMQRLVSVGADRTLVLWDIRQPQERAIGVVRSFVSHAGCIWDVLAVERRREEAGGASGEEERQTERERQRDEQRRDGKLLVPDQSLVTCAADNSLRFWHLSREAVAQAKLNRGDKSKWSDQQLHCMHTPDGSVKCMLSLAPYTHTAQLAASRADLLVTGDTAGVVRVWSLSTLQLLNACAVGDKEVKCVEYDSARDTLVAGCRDGQLHSIDLSALPSLKAVTLPSPHSSAVTALAVTSKGLLLSISSDKSIVFRAFSPASGTYTLQSTAYFKSGTPHHLVLHPSDRYAAVCTSDRYIRLFDLSTQKESRQYRLPSDSLTPAEPLRLALDGSGRLLAVCSSDRSVSVVEWFSGAVLCVLHGHGSVLTAVRWTAGGGRLVTVSADGCLFVWTVDERWARLIRDQSKRVKRSSGTGASGIASGLDSARSVNGGLLSARRRRSALEYLDEDESEDADRAGALAGAASGLDAMSELDATSASDLDLLDEDDNAARSPKPAHRPAAVPLLALPAPTDERKEAVAKGNAQTVAEEKESTGNEYKPLTANLPDWARTASTQPAVPASPPAPRSTRWSLRAQSGYKMVSELDGHGVEVTPRVHRRREERDGVEDREAGQEVEEEEGLHMAAVQEEKEEAVKPSVQRSREAETEENIAPPSVSAPAVSSKRNSAPGSPAAVIGRPSVTPPASFSPALPPRPQRDGTGQTPPPLSPAAAPSTPPQPPPRRSQPSSRSSSRNASPSVKPRQLEALAPPDSATVAEQRVSALLSPLSPMRALPAVPSQLPHSPRSSLTSLSPALQHSPSLAHSLQSLQQQLSHALGLFQQHRSAGVTPLVQQSEQQLLSMQQQLTQALSEPRVEPLKPVGAVDELERSLTLGGSSGGIGGGTVGGAAGGGGGVVGETLDRYSSLLLDMVMKKLDLRSTREL